jgi:hypothetical protein
LRVKVKKQLSRARIAGELLFARQKRTIPPRPASRQPDAVHIRCADIAIHVEGDTVTAYIRNGEGSSYVFESLDRGEDW